MTFQTRSPFDNGYTTLKPAKEQTFRQFMKQFKKQPNRFGDLANDMYADSNFTKKNTKEGILEYLEGLGACDNAIIAFKDAWRCYRYIEKEICRI